MNRDFIVIVGAQGAGKSVWAKKYTAKEKRLFVFDPMASYNADFTVAIDDYADDIMSGKIRQFRLGSHYPDDLPLIGSLAYAAQQCTVVIEESALVFKRGQLLDDWAKRIIFVGRHAQVNLLVLAQRASSIPVDIRSQATRFVSFRQTEPDDVRACADRIGGRAKDELSDLPDLTCLDWQSGNVDRYTVTPGT